MNSVWENAFKISTSGRPVSPALPTFATIASLESLELSIDGTVQDWYAFDAEGFARNLVTAKKITFNGTAKVTADDAGNEYIQGKILAIGTAAQSMFELTFPSGAKLEGSSRSTWMASRPTHLLHDRSKNPDKYLRTLMVPVATGRGCFLS